MAGIFDEKIMMQALEKYLPDGETITAGIHGVGIETDIKQVFGKCIIDDDRIIPSENGITLQVTKSKVSRYDVYIGITANYLILSECEVYKHYYEFDDVSDVTGIEVTDLDKCIILQDIGNCFPLSQIQSCVIKNAWMGSVNCSIKMKNGSTLKLMFPKRGGVGKGMPNHAKYREEIIACLSAYST